MERNFHRWPTLSTKPERNWSTVTFFNWLKHVLRTPSQPSFDMFLSWLRRFEFRAKIKNQLICLNFGKRQKHQKVKRKVDSCRRSLPDVLFPSPQDLVLPEEIFPVPRVMNVSQNLRAENNSWKRRKRTIFFDAPADFVARIDIFHLLTQTSESQLYSGSNIFSLLLKTLYIGKTNVSRTLLSPCIIITKIMFISTHETVLFTT
jgi:hypothetical protein